MRDESLISLLPFSKPREISTWVENRRSFTLDNMELNIFETYQVSEMVPLKFDDMVLINMIKGKKVMHLCNTEAFEYLPGQTLILPQQANMKIDFPEASLMAPTQCTALTVSRQKIDEVLAYLNEFYPKQQFVGQWNLDPDKFHLYNTVDLARLTNKLFQTILGNDPLKNVMADLTFKELVISILQCQSLLALDISSDKNLTVLHYLKDFVQQHLSENITIDMLLIQANMSRSSLFRLFKTHLGISPFEYIIRARLKEAKRILQLTHSTKEACFSTGFNDVSYFIRLFKNRVGITPGEYIAQH